MKSVIFIYLFFCFLLIQAQSNIPAKVSTQAIVGATGVGTIDSQVYAWSAGEPVIFTGVESQGFLTQGFHQPMVCKATPTIVALNQTSCALPYVLSVTSVFDVYRWYFAQSIIANASTYEYMPVENGNHRVLVGDSTGCVLLSEITRVDLTAKNVIPTLSAQGTAQLDTLLTSSVAASYQWYVVTPDNIHRAIVGETNQTYAPFYNGVYYVKVFTDEQCVSVSDYYTINNTGWDNIIRHDFEKTDSTIKIIKLNFFTHHKLKAWPIPTHQNLHIEYESPEFNTVALQIYDVKGLLVHTKSVQNSYGKIEILYNTEHLPSGKYLLNVVDGDKKIVQNLIFE